MVDVFEIVDGVYMVSEYLRGNMISINIFVVVDENVSIIDTGSQQVARDFLEAVKKIVKMDEISNIFLTHEHLDHMGGLPEFASEAYNARIYAHKSLRIQLGFMGLATGIISLEGREVIPIGNRRIRIIHAPIETLSKVVYLLEPDGILFSGDYFGQLSEFNWSPISEKPLKEIVEEIKKFHEGLGYTKEEINKYLKPLLKYNIKILAPAHGSIIKEDTKKIIEEVIKAKIKPSERGSLWRKIFRI